MSILFNLLFITLVLGKDLSDLDFDDDFEELPVKKEGPKILKPLNPIVEVFQGGLRGVWKKSVSGRTYASFEGIPYARPPVGKDKFKDPEPVEPWTGLWNATETPLNDCVHYDPYMQVVQGGEDCLYLNVYTPNLKSKPLLPVLVFIHGGMFLYGSGAVYQPDFLMDRDLVLVTFNYRLGPLGFISTGDDAAPGNVGLKDQVLALRWVKDNAEAFGGDPQSITIMGISAGAASVHYHYLSPRSRGLFTRGIALSGTAFAPWAYSATPMEKTTQLANILGCEAIDSHLVMDCLSEKPSDVIVEATLEMFNWNITYFSSFTPVAEPATTKEAFLIKSPFKATADGDMYPAPLLVSVTAGEGLYPAAMFQRYPELLEELDSNWSELASDVFHLQDTLSKDQRASTAQKIKDHYFGEKRVGNDTFKQLVQAIGDRAFVAGAGRLAQAHGKAQAVYLARYAYRGEKSLSFAFTWTADDYGVSHADDVLHIFKLPFLSSTMPDDVTMTKALLDMVYSFGTTGKPWLSDGAPEWKPASTNSSELNYMEIESPTKFEMKSDADFGQKSFWDSLDLDIVDKDSQEHVNE